MRCILDTNILINMVNRYPRDLFASLWESMEGAVASGEICAVSYTPLTLPTNSRV